MSETQSSGGTSELCARVRAEMERALDGALAIDGEPGFEGELGEHLIECDDCRDLVFEVERAAKAVLGAGDDFRHPEDFTDRVLARVAELEQKAPPPRTEAKEAPTASGSSPVFRMQAPEPATAAIGRFLRGPRGTPVLATLLAAAAVFLLWLGEGRPPRSGDSGAPRANSVDGSGLGEPWQGRVTAVVRGFGSRDGLSLCASEDRSDCRSLETGASVPRGGVLLTDGLTRARLELDDGTEVALDKKSELLLDPSRARQATLQQGDAIFDVARRPDGHGELAVVRLPFGRIDVLGTKFSVHVDAEGARVDVSRGEVRLVDDEDRDVAVSAGQSGRLYPGSAPEVAPVLALGDAFAWSERTFARTGSQEEGPRGLGELRAKKPGEREELRDAVALTRHSVKVRIHETMARTEIEEVFTNRTDERLEGILRFPLPPDAQIESLALEVDGHWEEGAFVDRERAAAIWRGAIVNSSQKPKPVREEIVWVPGPWRDPALLEWQGGGRFELRIFPIEKRSSRRVRLSYTQKLTPTGDRVHYSYPLAHDPSGSTRVDQFEFEAEVRGHDGMIQSRGYDLEPVETNSGGARRVLRRSDFVPSGDINLSWRLPEVGREVRAWAYRDGGAVDSTVAIALRPNLPLATERAERAYVFVVDRSRSMYGEQWQRAARLVTRAIRELDREALVAVLDCDTECSAFAPDFRTADAALADDVARYFDGVRPEGASDLVAALRRAAALGERAPDRRLEIVYVGDGSPTVGEVQPGLLSEAARGLASERLRISAVTVGAEADLTALSAVTRAGGGVVVPFQPGETVADVAFAVLGATYGAALRDVRLTLPPGLDDVSPRQLDNLIAGDELLVVARMAGERVQGEVRLTGKIGDEPFERSYDVSLVASGSDGNAFVPRLFAATQIADLEQETGAEARERVVRLSQQWNVASRHTSLLVLESPAMFRAFGLDNQRRAPVWTGEVDAVETEAGEVLERSGPVDLAFDLDGDAPHDDAFGEVGSGSLSSGSVSNGSGRGASGAAKARRPAFAPAPAAPPKKSSERSRDERSESWPGAETESRLERRPVEPIPPPPGRRMVPMRKVWDRVGTISTTLRPASLDDDELAKRRARFEQNPLSRDALVALYAGYLLVGDLERAEELAERWSEKDPLDPDALTARADLAAQRGDRQLALRILGSVIDVRPSDHQASFRLARAYRWAGSREQGCRYALADAQRRSRDARAVAGAVRCLRELGQERVAAQVLRGAVGDARVEAERLLAAGEGDGSSLSGDLRVEGEWEGAVEDLDLVIVHPDGYRVSWLGAPTRAVISATDVTSERREGLALRGAPPGDYAIEVVRTNPERGAGMLRGELRIRAGSQTRTIPFALGETRTRVATVKVSMRSRLVPL